MMLMTKITMMMMTMPAADDDDDDEDFNVVADAAIIVAVEIGYLCICTSLPSTADDVISVPVISCGNYC